MKKDKVAKISRDILLGYNCKYVSCLTSPDSKSEWKYLTQGQVDMLVRYGLGNKIVFLTEHIKESESPVSKDIDLTQPITVTYSVNREVYESTFSSIRDLNLWVDFQNSLSEFDSSEESIEIININQK